MEEAVACASRAGHDRHVKTNWSNLHTANALENPFQSDWLTAAEAAVYLKVKPRSLLVWVRHGKVRAYALSGIKRRIWRFRREDLDAVLFASPVIPSDPPTVLSERRSN
jgi:excisionase family DNA binding protein